MKIDWSSFGFIGGYHLLLFLLLPYYLLSHTPSWTLIIFTVILYILTGISVTAGYHRLYSHRSYEAGIIPQLFFLFFASAAAEGSAIRWSFDHRNHHRFSDTPKDPYSVDVSLLHAHILWIFKKANPIEKKVVQDLIKNPLVRMQHHFYEVCLLFSNLILFFIGVIITGDVLGSFVFATLLRMFLVHHSTWFINSLAHYWGSKLYSREESAVNNWILAFFTFGEGYHNFHHVFPTDYRNGVKWYQFDPTKGLIRLLNKIGFASNLKSTKEINIKKRMVLEDVRYLTKRLDKKHHKELEGRSKAILNEFSEQGFQNWKLYTNKLSKNFSL